MEFETPDHLARQNGLAREWMQQGIALLNQNKPDRLRDAVGCFDNAIELRRRLPLDSNAWFRYGYIAGWMNRADALTRLGSPDDLAEALHSYDVALEQLRQLPLGANPLFRRRLAIAWLNRGMTMKAQRTLTSLRSAAESFSHAIAALTGAGEAEDQIVIGAAWMNRGNTLLQLDASREAHAAHECARHALAHLAAAERNDGVAAEAGFKARHVLCRAIAHQLADLATPSADHGTLLDEATDAVDAGMALGRDWETRGETRFRPLISELFRFGCRAYQAHQPRFLTEFLIENLEAARKNTGPESRMMHTAAIDAIWRDLGRLLRNGFGAVNTPEFAQMLEQLKALRIAEEKLIEFRSHWDR
jgi:tetratricopeptide (TPR) repeat protein